MKKTKILVLKNGERIPVKGEDGKWWLTDGGRFRKLRSEEHTSELQSRI